MKTYYYLTRWKVWLENTNELDGVTKENAYLLFMALKELPKEEVLFLAEKYIQNVEGCLHNKGFKGANSYKPRTDKVMAEVAGLDVREYTRKRLGIEASLSQNFKVSKNSLEQRKKEKLESFYLQAGGLYISKFEFSRYGKLQEPIQCTTKKDLAYLFQADSEIARTFEQALELKRVDPERDESTDKIVWVDIFADDRQLLEVLNW